MNSISHRWFQLKHSSLLEVIILPVRILKKKKGNIETYLQCAVRTSVSESVTECLLCKSLSKGSLWCFTGSCWLCCSVPVPVPVLDSRRKRNWGKRKSLTLCLEVGSLSVFLHAWLRDVNCVKNLCGYYWVYFCPFFLFFLLWLFRSVKVRSVWTLQRPSRFTCAACFGLTGWGDNISWVESYEDGLSEMKER